MGKSSQQSEPAGPVTSLPSPNLRRGVDFYVAGGPVAPDRACYVSRTTDRQLHKRLQAGEYCHVIAPRFTGKSSLAARTAARLRSEGRLTAIVDLSQLGSRDGSTEAGRWYYGLAYRIVRDLRLKLDLQSWWQERMPLPLAQRLGEFFREVVLASTRSPVVIFLDEIDSVEQLDYATDLFQAVRACHDARAAEPEFERLCFALLGTALPTGKAARAGAAVAEVAVKLALPDFRFEESRVLAPGLGMPAGDAERALYRIMYWTSGHPYLTQKLCQAVARNAARIDSDEAVDRLVAARFLARNAVSSESSMSRVLDGLERAGRLARPALRLYRRIRRGRRPRYDSERPEHELLRVCGLVTVTKDRRLAVRNRIYAHVFSHRWAREALPAEWARIGRAAAVIGLLAAALWAYLEVLPRPYEETLRVASVELDEAFVAWSSLRRIPGFSAKADRLFARVLARRSRLADTWLEAAAIDGQLRTLPGYQPRADALLVEYWERRAAAAEAAEQRDEALLYRLRAHEAGPTADWGLAAQLAGGDYRRLQAVIRPAGLVEAVAPAAQGAALVTVSAGHVVERWDAATGLAIPGPRLELLAEEFVALRRRLSIDAAGRVSAPRLELEIEHPRLADLVVGLATPSGRRVEWPASRGRSRDGRLVFDEAVVPELRALRGEAALGTWLLEVEDRTPGETGLFAGWMLQASPQAGHRAEERPDNPMFLPDPALSSSVRVALSAGATAVAAAPRKADARGRLQVWEVDSGHSLAKLEVGAAERWLDFAGEDILLVAESAASGARLRVLDIRAGAVRDEYLTKAALAAVPALSPDGLYVAVVESSPQVAWVRALENGAESFRISTAGEVTAVAVAPGGRLLALADAGSVVRIWQGAGRRLLAELEHESEVRAMTFDPSSRWLATVDVEHRIRLWDLATPQAPAVLVRHGDPSRQFGFDAAGHRLAVLGRARGFEVWGLPEAVPHGPELRHSGVGREAAAAPGSSGAGTLFTPGGGRLVSGRGTRSVRVWEIEAQDDPAGLPRIPPVVALASSGLRMAAGLADGRVLLRTRDPESLELRQQPVTAEGLRHGGEVTALAFSPAGDRLVTVGSDGSVLLWHAAAGRPAGAIFHHGGGRVESVELAPDGRTLVTAGNLGARSWDAESGTPGPALGPGRAVSAVAVDPAGRRAFTGSPAGAVEAWDLASGERLWSALVDGAVTTIAVASDGARLAVAGPSGLVHAWDLESGGGSLAANLAAPVSGLQFSPDGEAILAQTSSWMHRLEVIEGRLRVLASRLLPGGTPPGAWRSASPDGLRVVLVGGTQGETLVLLDFERAPSPPEDWVPDREGWQTRLKLSFTPAGDLRAGPPPPPVEQPGPALEPLEARDPVERWAPVGCAEGAGGHDGREDCDPLRAHQPAEQLDFEGSAPGGKT
jgi:WD40 repeat protein